jgi:hypothetical protein
MRTLKARNVSVGTVLTLVFMALLMYFVGEGFKKTLGPFPDPVRYSWDSGRHCVVVYPDKREVSCGSFTKDELNEFRLEYADPHPKPRRK